MATASIRSYRNAISPVVDASRDDLVVGDTVTVESVNTGSAYSWSLAYVPDGSSAALSPPGGVTGPGPLTFSVDLEGSYLVRLQFTDGSGTTEQFVRLRARTAFADLGLVAAGEQYGATRVPVDATATGWADEQNANLKTLEGFIKGLYPSRNVLHVDPTAGNYQTVQAAINYAQSQTPTAAAPWMILIRPGVYTEDLTLYSFVYLVGWPGDESRAVVQISNNTTASHTLALSGASGRFLAANIYFQMPGATANPTIAQTGSGQALYQGCRFESQGNTGEAYSSTGIVEFRDCVLTGGTVNVTDYALRVTTSAGAVTLKDCTVTGASGIYLGTEVTASLTGCVLTLTGTYGIYAECESLRVGHSRISGATTAVAGNPTGAAVPADLTIDVLWSEVGPVSINGTGVVGTASMTLDYSKNGAVSVAGGAELNSAIVFDEGEKPATGTNKGAIFVSDGTGGLTVNHLYYVDEAGATTDLLTGGGGSSLLTSVTAGENLLEGDAVVSYWDAGNAEVRVKKAVSDAATDTERLFHGVAQAAATTGNSVDIGTIAGTRVVPLFDVAPSSSDIWKPVYVDDTAGQVTLTAPTASGHTVFRVGFLESHNGAGGDPQVVLQPALVAVIT